MAVSVTLRLLFLVFGICILCDGALCSKILLFPYATMRNSRLQNVMRIGKMLAARNHSVSMLIASNVEPREITPGVELIRVEMITETVEVENETLLNGIHVNPLPLLQTLVQNSVTFVDSLFGNETLLDSLRSKAFDLIFVDIISVEGLLLRDYLDIPGIGYSNLGFDNDWDSMPPVHPAYMPNVLSAQTDHMDFWQRCMNAASLTLLTPLKLYIFRPFVEAKRKYNLNATFPIETAVTRLSVMIVNVDFVFDYPRPVFPWIKTVSGVLFNPPNPLSRDLESFVESSGEHGIIVMSFGSMIPELKPETAEMIARVFARLPQKVIWRNRNSSISGLGNNTKVLPWIPQNDLVGHPKTRLFISHCGVSGSHEALYHGVPVVAVPLLVDQFQHAKKFVRRLKMGEELDFYNLSEDSFSVTVLSVLNNPSYFANAKRASAAARDQPMDGKEELIYWVEYVIRHKGTLHFHSQAMERLNWFQYLLLDVIAFILSIITITMVFLYYTCKMFCSKVCKRTFKTKSKSE